MALRAFTAAETAGVEAQDPRLVLQQGDLSGDLLQPRIGHLTLYLSGDQRLNFIAT